ncbi:FIST signal transduction protein [Psychromonas antarctica]|uniref:FIST signal transduction protein n=1 Tax=Psychromonas antarctica TaxID=67573 RepID=UPI001EE7FA69|nr:FIST N-terminal domain-containing protein [Psychromonas antarctica]MCG6202123.1 FIST C-terminal domain-containing protein [Psychromonas antarctica]
MKTHQNVFIAGAWENTLVPLEKANLVLLFGDRQQIKNHSVMENIRTNYPHAQIVGCTTSGEILGTKIYDDSLCLTAIEFKHSYITVRSASINNKLTYDVAKNLADEIYNKDLRYVMVLCDGQQINGSELVNGLQASLPENILITGGLAGDGTIFNETLVWHNENAETGKILLVGFYGDKLSFSHGCICGSEAFGPDRTITKSDGNILYELDNKPALALYKKYLGPHAKNLPASALFFPLSIKLGDQRVFRTILNINNNNDSMVFAGDLPEGSTVQLMHSSVNKLIDGAEIAAEQTQSKVIKDHDNGLALLISCVGRRLVLNKFSEDELEIVKDVLGDNWTYTGFYSYGELSPLPNSSQCSLHNQTITITTICETNE